MMILLFLNIRSFCGTQEKPEDRRQNTVNRKKKKVNRIVFEFFEQYLHSLGLDILMMLPAHNRSA